MFSLKGKPLNQKSMVMVMNVLNYFRRTSGDVGETILVERTADACGISERTVYRTKKRFETAELKGTAVAVPQKTRYRLKAKSVDVDDFIKAVIRRKIYFKHLNQHPVTTKSLIEELRKDGVFEFSKSSFQRCLQSIGFSSTIEDQRKGLLEQPDIMSLRAKFLREYIENKKDNVFDTVFLGHTCFSTKESSRRKSKGDEEKRYIVLHAGNSQGFINGIELIFLSKSKKIDYFDINADYFKKWFTEQLLPNLKKPSLIIFGNTSYNTRPKEKIVNTSWSKEELLEYLQTKNISHHAEMLKIELYTLAKSYPVSQLYEIDEVASDLGHKVLRLPPYHCQFNPIELAWRQCKMYYYKHNGRDRGENVFSQWSKALSQVTGEDWTKFISHAENEIMEFWRLEQQLERLQEPVIITMRQDSSDDDEEMEEDFEEECISTNLLNIKKEEMFIT